MRSLIAVAAVAFALPAAAQTCLKPGDAVEIAGKLTQITLPGPPNYQDISKGDRPEAGYYLKLDKPVCAAVSELQRDDLGQTKDDVQFVQLLKSSDDFPPSRTVLGMRQGYAGILVAPETAHHRTQLMLDDMRLLWLETQ